MKENVVTERIRKFLVQHFPATKNVGDEDPLLENGIIDSLGVLDLVSFMEEAFTITVSDEELLPENFQTIERLTAFVQSKRNGEIG